MGQQNSYEMGTNATLSLVQQLPIGKIFKEEQDQSLYFIKEYTYTSQQAFQQAFIKFSTKLATKNQNILNLEKTNTKVENTFCSIFYKIILIFQYIDYSLADEIQMRNKQNRNFEEKQIWSVLFHCTLAIVHLRTTEGIQHSAIALKDIKLSEDGTIKIMPTEMIGIYSQHDLSEGTTKKLAMTILSCMLMKQVTNQSNEYLQALIDKTKCSKQLKKALYLMIMEDTNFKQLQEYLFKLANDDNDSVFSGVSTPVYSSHKKTIKDSVKMGVQQNKLTPKNQLLQPSNRQKEDQIQQEQQFYTFQFQNPDENDEDKNVESTQGQTTQNFELDTFSVQNNVQFKLKDFCNKEQEDVTVRINKRTKDLPSYSQSQNHPRPDNLYTDPKLLDLIKRDLEQIQLKSRISFGLKQPVELNYRKTNQVVSRPKRESAHNSDFNVKPTEMETLMIRTEQIKNESLSQSPEGQRAKGSATFDQTFKQIQNLPKRAKQQECFGNIFDEQASFKKQKSKKIKVRQSQVKKSVNKQNFCESTETKRIMQSNAKNEPSNVEKQVLGRNSQFKLTPQSVKLNMQTQEQSQSQLVCQTYQKGQYRGYKLNGLRHGAGTFFYKEGGKYIGEWKQSKMNGKGTLYYPNDQVAYEGNWRDDKLHGYGTLYNQQISELHGSFQYQDWSAVEQYWTKYEGEFSMDNKEGKGKWYLSNGQVFEGHFKEDMVEGQGVLSRQNGSRVRGIWRKNKLIRLY